MDRDTLQDDLDEILGPRPNAEPIGEWDWEPPLGTALPDPRPADEPEDGGEEEDADGDGD